MTTSLRDPKASAHRRAILRELKTTHCPRCSTFVRVVQPHGQDCAPRDEVVVSRLVAGVPVESTRRERLEAVRMLSARGHSAQWIAGHMRIAERSVTRLRAELITRREVAA